jgi:hypothetical protein
MNVRIWSNYIRHYAEFRTMPSKLAGPCIFACFSRPDSA